MHVRAAREDDFAAIAAITNFYIATTAIHFAYEPVTVDELRAQWAKARAKFPWLVADRTPPSGGAADRGAPTGARDVVGYAKAGTWRERAAYGWTTEVGLYVADRERGRGVGRALYAALLDELTRRGFRSAVAGIALPNDASRELHRGFGFTPVGVFEDAGWKPPGTPSSSGRSASRPTPRRRPRRRSRD
jgi:phosphinothricin acetyltransferase